MASKGQKFKKHDNKIKEEIICKLQSGTLFITYIDFLILISYSTKPNFS